MRINIYTCGIQLVLSYTTLTTHGHTNLNVVPSKQKPLVSVPFVRTSWSLDVSRSFDLLRDWKQQLLNTPIIAFQCIRAVHIVINIRIHLSCANVFSCFVCLCSCRCSSHQHRYLSCTCRSPIQSIKRCYREEVQNFSI